MAHSRSRLWRRTSIVPMMLVLLLCVGCSSQPTPLLRPNGVVVQPDGSLFVTDRGNYRIVHVAANGSVLATFGQFGTAQTDIHSAWDLAQSPSGQLLFTNLVYNDATQLTHDGIKVFEPNGTFVREIAATDYNASDETLTNSPYGLAVDQQERVWIANYYANTLTAYRIDGTPLTLEFSAPPEFRSISDVAIDDARQRVYLTDAIGCTVYQYAFEASGDQITLTYQTNIGTYGDADGQFSYPNYLAINQQNGDVYVGDMGNQRIQVLNAAGVFQRSFAPDVATWQVLGLAFANNQLYAADAFNNVVWEFNLDGTVQRRLEVQQ